jgi:hypothetical protein
MVLSAAAAQVEVVLLSILLRPALVVTAGTVSSA